MLVQAYTCVAPVMRTEEVVPERRALRGRRKMTDRAQGEWRWNLLSQVSGHVQSHYNEIRVVLALGHK